MESNKNTGISIYTHEVPEKSRRPLPVDLLSEDSNHFDSVIKAFERMRKTTRGTITNDERHVTIMRKINQVLEDIDHPTEADEAIKAVSEYNFSGNATHDELIDILLSIFKEKTDGYISANAKKRAGINRNSLSRKEIQTLLWQSIEETIRGISEKGKQIVQKIPRQAGVEKKAFTKKAINTKKKILITEFSTILTELRLQPYIVGILFPKQLRYVQEDGNGGYMVKHMNNAEFVARYLKEYEYFLKHANNVLAYLETIIKKDLNNFNQDSYLEYIGTNEKVPKTVEMIQSEVISLYAIGGIRPYIVALEQESVYPELMKAYKQFQKKANAHSGGFKHFMLRYSHEYLDYLVSAYPGYSKDNINLLQEVRANKKNELFQNLSLSTSDIINRRNILLFILILVLAGGLYFVLNNSGTKESAKSPSQTELPEKSGPGQGETKEQEDLGEQKKSETDGASKASKPKLATPKTKKDKKEQPKTTTVHLSGTYQYLGGALGDPKMQPYIDKIPGRNITEKANRLYNHGNTGRRNGNSITFTLK